MVSMVAEVENRRAVAQAVVELLQPVPAGSLYAELLQWIAANARDLAAARAQAEAAWAAGDLSLPRLLADLERPDWWRAAGALHVLTTVVSADPQLEAALWDHLVPAPHPLVRMALIRAISEPARPITSVESGRRLLHLLFTEPADTVRRHAARQFMRWYLRTPVALSEPVGRLITEWVIEDVGLGFPPDPALADLRQFLMLVARWGAATGTDDVGELQAAVEALMG